MKITENMVNEFNQSLNDMGCIFRLKAQPTTFGDNTSCDIVPASVKFIKSSIINPTDEFFEVLENYFAKQGIEKLTYNNTGTTFWSRSGFDN